MRSLSEFVVPSSDARRKAQNRLTRFMPADAAAAATLLLLPGRDPDRPFTAEPDTHDSGLAALRRTRALVPLIEPNVLAWGRMITHKGAAPSPQVAADGVLTATWPTTAHHHAKAAVVVREYLDRHDLVPGMRDRLRHSGLDSFHEPLVLAPVRHTYADGSPSVLRWQAVDGTARVVAARLAFADAFGSWLGDHPYADATNDWPTDAVTLRQFLAAARIEADRLAQDYRDREGQDVQVQTSWYLTTPGIEDFADLILPTTVKTAHGNIERDLSHWNFMSHTSGSRPDPERFTQPVTGYIRDLDIWAGTDPYQTRGLDPAHKADRDDLAECEDLVREWLLTPGGPDSVRAARITLFAAALTDQATAPRTNADGLLRAYATTVLGNTAEADATADEATQALATLVAAIGTPDLGDLYGVQADLTADYIADPLRDPANPWWWLGAAQGVMYAVTLGHLAGHDVPATVTWLLVTDTGREQVLAYADALQDGKARVPLVGGRPGQWASAYTLSNLAKA